MLCVNCPTWTIFDPQSKNLHSWVYFYPCTYVLHAGVFVLSKLEAWCELKCRAVIGLGFNCPAPVDSDTPSPSLHVSGGYFHKRWAPASASSLIVSRSRGPLWSWHFLRRGSVSLHYGRGTAPPLYCATRLNSIWSCEQLQGKVESGKEGDSGEFLWHSYQIASSSFFRQFYRVKAMLDLCLRYNDKKLHKSFKALSLLNVMTRFDKTKLFVCS